MTNSELNKKIDSVLTKIFDNSLLLNELKNQKFQDLILEQISNLSYIEKSSSKSKKKDNSKKTRSKKTENIVDDTSRSIFWLNKLNELIDKKLDIDSKVKKNQTDLIDEIGYIEKYILNVYNIDINYENTTNKEKIVANDTIKSNVDLNDTTNKNFVENNYFGSMFGMNQEQNIGNLKEQFYRQVATKKFYDDVNKGVFYQYLSKPKIIPIFKYVVGALSIIFSILIVLTIGFLIGSSGFKFKNDNEPNPVKFSSTTYVISYVIFLCIGAWISYILFKPSITDNQKFYFPFKRIIFICVITFVLLILSIVQYAQLLISLPSKIVDEEYSKSQFKFFEISSYIFFASCFVFAIMTLMTIITNIYNPKLDSIRIKQKLDQLYDETKKQDNQL